jgi:fucose permease
VDDERTGRRLLIAGGLLSFLMLGWIGLLMPSLIRDIQRDLGINDAEMGLTYGVFTTAFLVGCLVAGTVTSRTGRRPVLLGALALMVVGTAAVLVPSWPAFLAGSAVRGLGSGMIEVGIQALFLASFAGPMQNRAINSVHFMYSLGATLAPLAMATLLGLGLVWSGAMALSVIPLVAAMVLLGLAPIGGRPARAPGPSVRLSVTGPLVAASAAIALYVAAEAGISSWLVRFLDEVDLGLAATALALFWVALAASRLLVARFATHVAPERLTIAGFVVGAGTLVAAVVVPSTTLAIAMFAATGFALGPVYAGIILLGGRVSPTHKDAVTSVLASTAVAGAIVYPPIMGAISLGAGLGVAMVGAAVACLGGALLVGVAARRLQPADTRDPIRLEAAA